MKNLRQLAIESSQYSHSPYSLAKVGCALETQDGSLYKGCNIENSSYGGTVCAERVAIWKAVSEGHRRLKKIYVYTRAGWPPCGLCLQVMAEFGDKNTEITIGNEKGEEKVYSLSELLPLSFGPEHLKNN